MDGDLPLRFKEYAIFFDMKDCQGVTYITALPYDEDDEAHLAQLIGAAREQCRIWYNGVRLAVRLPADYMFGDEAVVPPHLMTRANRQGTAA